MLQDHQAELDKMEIEWKLEETRMLAEIKQKEAETRGVTIHVFVLNHLGTGPSARYSTVHG